MQLELAVMAQLISKLTVFVSSQGAGAAES